MCLALYRNRRRFLEITWNEAHSSWKFLKELWLTGAKKNFGNSAGDEWLKDGNLCQCIPTVCGIAGVVGALQPSATGHAPLASCPKQGTMRRNRKGWWVLRTAKGTNTERGQQPKQENISTPQLMMAELRPPHPPSLLLHSVGGGSDDGFFFII